MVLNYPSFRGPGHKYTAIYRGGPLNDLYEDRESVGSRLEEISVEDDTLDGRYVLSDGPGNGRGGIWFYLWTESGGPAATDQDR